MNGEPITREQIRMLRNASVIGFHYGRELATITATKFNAKHAEQWSTRVECNNRISTHGDDTPTSAHECIISAQYDHEWQTIASLLKPGDVLTLVWSMGGQTTEALRARDMVGDSVSLKVTRGDRNMQFHVGVLTCPTHSTARMCKA